MMRFIESLPIALLLTSCGSQQINGGKYVSDGGAGIYKIESSSGWSSEVALRPSQKAGHVENESAAVTSSEIDEVIVSFDDHGRLVKVTVFDNSSEQNRSYIARSIGGTIQGRAIEIRPSKTNKQEQGSGKLGKKGSVQTDEH